MGFESFSSAPQESGENSIIESGERLKENELILPEDDIERAKEILSDIGISFEDRSYTTRQPVNDSSWVPAEFILSIKSESGEDADFDKVEEVFKLLQDNNVVVRYGFNPRKAST